MKTSFRLTTCIAFAHVTLLGLLMIWLAGHAFSQADFYKGKTIKIIRGGGPGGSGEFQTRALVRVSGKVYSRQTALHG